MSISKGRIVTMYEWECLDGASRPIKKKIGRGVLLDFGIDYEDFDDYAATYSTAIVELDDGSVKNVPVCCIVFEDDGAKN